MAEHRDTDQFGGKFNVDYSGQQFQTTGKTGEGNRPIVIDLKAEKEMKTFDQETALMRAFNEIREYTPGARTSDGRAFNMTPQERDMFNSMIINIFKKHGVTEETYSKYYQHLGTPASQQGHR